MLHAVLFDLDNTLIDRDRAFRESMEACVRDARARAELVRLDARGRGSRHALFAAWTRLAGSSMDQKIFGAMIAGCLRPDQGLIGTLREMGQEFLLGIITNGGSEVQRAKYAAAGFGEVIPPERVWVSEEVGAPKPDPVIFRYACDKLGVRPENCLYLGDNEHDDFHGAMKAGLRARLVEGALDAEQLKRIIAQELTR
jgi:putative hydrolase of the HAD superfamily